MTLKFKRDIWPVDPKYPNAWRGEISLQLRTAKRSFRVMYFPADRENDWMHVDYSKTINIAPRWAKWFGFSTYGSFRRFFIAHLTIGHICFSTIPGKDGWI